MPEDKELIRRALMRDQEAQKECTEKNIVLPCPFCGASGDDINLDYNSDISQFWIHCWKCHADGPLANYNANDAFALWNTRPAPPIGKCGECKHQFTGDSDICHSGMDNEFCNGFEPKEE